MIFALGTPHRGHTMPELDRLAIVFLPYSYLDSRNPEKDTRCRAQRPDGFIVTCTVFRNFTGVPFNVAGRYRQFRAAATAMLS